jgi:hypothetical protein
VASRNHYVVQYQRLRVSSELCLQVTHELSPVPESLRDFLGSLTDDEAAGLSPAESEKRYLRILQGNFYLVFSSLAENLRSAAPQYEASLDFLKTLQSPETHPTVARTLATLRRLADQMERLESEISRATDGTLNAAWDHIFRVGKAAVKSCEVMLKRILGVIETAKSERRFIVQERLTKESNGLANEANVIAKGANSRADDANDIAKGANTRADEANDISGKANDIAKKADRTAVGAALIAILALGWDVGKYAYDKINENAQTSKHADVERTPVTPPITAPVARPGIQKDNDANPSRHNEPPKTAH